MNENIDEKLFEGEDRLTSISKKRKEDFDNFNALIDKLEFESEKEAVGFCASIGMYKTEMDDVDKKFLSATRQLVSMQRVRDARLFDRLLIAMGHEEDRLETFMDYFYTGFLILNQWLEEEEPDIDTVVEKYHSLHEYIESYEENE